MFSAFDETEPEVTGFRNIFQLGYAVADLEAAVAAWVSRGVGPFFVIDPVSFAEVTLRGRPVTPTLSIALAQAGPLQIELLAERGESSAIGAFLARRGPGLHHLSALTERFDTDLAAWASRGVPALQLGRSSDGTRFAFLETDPGAEGAVLELVQPSAGLLRLFARIRSAAESWDGSSHPIRRL